MFLLNHLYFKIIHIGCHELNSWPGHTLFTGSCDLRITLITPTLCSPALTAMHKGWCQNGKGIILIEVNNAFCVVEQFYWYISISLDENQRMLFISMRNKVLQACSGFLYNRGDHD